MNAKNDFPLPQAPFGPRGDLRMMLRNHVVRRSLECMETALARREEAIRSGRLETYQNRIREVVRESHGVLPAGPGWEPPRGLETGRYEKEGYRIENVLFESFPGWEVNATVYVPLDFQPPFRVVVVPVGHSGKQFTNYQIPCQFFARSGFLAITFDPPGQAGEKQEGNDHFRDGVRPYLLGETSNRYFVADAIRCIDYLYTRSDVEPGSGVAMTGVSGGGVTTIFAALLDPRIAITAPSCCLSRLEDLAIRQAYAGCPEDRMWRRYADGIDPVDLVCSGAPNPVLIMAGKDDEVFRIGDTEALVGTARDFYRAGGWSDRIEFFADDSGHAYTLTQARRFVQFLDRWFGVNGTAAGDDRPDFPNESFRVNPASELQCGPSQKVNMMTLSRDRGDALRIARTSRVSDLGKAAAKLCGWTPGFRDRIGFEVGDRFPVWVHDFRQVRLLTESDIEVFGSLLIPIARSGAPIVLHFDDQGRDRLLEAGGLLGRAIRFVDRKNPIFGCFTVDLRGWGDTRPCLLPFDIPSWGSTDRFFAYSTAALGDGTMQMRVRDGLAALDFLREHQLTRESPLIVSGCGLGGIVASHVAAIDRSLQGVVLWDCLRSFEDLLHADDTRWSPEVFMPQTLKHYDLPELLGSVTCPVHWINPLDAMMKPLADPELLELKKWIGSHALIENGNEEAICAVLQGLLESCQTDTLV